MNQLNYSPLMTRYLLDQRVFSADPFSLIDVGASGGIGQEWKVFNDQFLALGFEPLLNSCEKLNSSAPPNVKYLPFFITSGDSRVDSLGNSPLSSSIFERTSAAHANKLLNSNYIKKIYNNDEEPIYTKDSISLDAFLLNDPRKMNFLKSDTDGFDYQVLYGAQKALINPDCLGVFIECQLHGELPPDVNVFRNIDRFLVEKGFFLFDISVNRYSMKALPTKFAYSIPAQTRSGRALCGDALYLRDYATDKDPQVDPIQLLKLACIQEIYGLYDCAAELLLAHRDRFSSLNINIDLCLDFLTQEIGIFSNYPEHRAFFETDPTRFYPNIMDHLQKGLVMRKKDLMEKLKQKFRSLLRNK